jgi:hypothetical protein
MHLKGYTNNATFTNSQNTREKKQKLNEGYLAYLTQQFVLFILLLGFHYCISGFLYI